MSEIKVSVCDAHIRPRHGAARRIESSHLVVQEITENTIRVSIPGRLRVDAAGQATLAFDHDQFTGPIENAPADLVVDYTFVRGYPAGLDQRASVVLQQVRGQSADPRTSLDQFRRSKGAV